jgi:hypothetical protein
MSEASGLLAGTGRTRITPPWDVPLGGTGQPWSRVRDHLAATALLLVSGNGTSIAALVSVDVHSADGSFRAAVQQALAPLAFPLYLAVTGSPRTPALSADPPYAQHVARQVATALVQAHRSLRPASLRVGAATLADWTQHRDDASLPVDQRLVLWRFEDDGRRPLAAVLSFAAPADVQQVLAPQDVSRDYPGQVTDLLERELPGVTALFLPAAAQDCVFRPESYLPDRCHTPGVAIAQSALLCWRRAQPVDLERWSGSGSALPFALEWAGTALEERAEGASATLCRLREQAVEKLLVRPLPENAG